MGDATAIREIYAAAMETAIELERLAENESTRELLKELASAREWWPVTVTRSNRTGRNPGAGELADYLGSLGVSDDSSISLRKPGGNEDFSRFVQWLYERISSRQRIADPADLNRSAHKWLASDEGKEWKQRYRVELESIPLPDGWAKWMGEQFPDKLKSARRNATEKLQLSRLTQRHLENYLLDDMVRTTHGFLRK